MTIMVIVLRVWYLMRIYIYVCCFFFLLFLFFFLFVVCFFLMIRRPPRSTLDRSSAASDVYKRQFQGFVTVNRCEGAACSGTWERKTTVNFIAKPFYAADAALTGRMSQQDVRAYPDTLMARTEYTWGMLDADGVSGMDPSRVPVLTQQIQRDYRGADIGTRTGFVYDAFGNQTQTQEFGQTLSGGSPRRTLERLYNVNLDTAGDNWVVNLVERETLWDGPAGGADAKIVRRTNFRYDGVTCANTSTNPTLGQLTAQDQYLSGSAANCSTGSWLTTSYTYSATRKWQVTRITDPAGRFKTYTWTNATQLGSVAYAVDGINYTTSYTYDPVFRWQVRDVTQPNGATTRYLYDVHARLREVKQPNASTGAVGETSVTYTYNDTGNPFYACLLYTSPSPRDRTRSRMPSSA